MKSCVVRAPKIITVVLALAVSVLVGWAQCAQAQESDSPDSFAGKHYSPAVRPNIVIILADDLGNADPGFQGGTIRTPNLDALAAEGVKFNDWYGQQLCTPARAALMTGRYPMRDGLQTGVIFPAHSYGLPLDEVTLPQALQSAGYETAMVGKWHLGHADRRYWPQNRGFDHFYGNLIGEVDYWTKDRGGLIDWQRNGTFLHEDGYFTEQIGAEAVKIIEGHDAAKPLFLYVASLAVHAPLQAPQPIIDSYAGRFETPERQTYAAMFTALDEQVGAIVAALKAKKMFENTLIFFSSDNGGVVQKNLAVPGGKPAKSPPASNAPFRAGKGSLYEGGVRVPAFMTWPNGLEPGESDALTHHVDIMPTFLKLAGMEATSGKPFDGHDLMPMLREGAPPPHDEILINVEPQRGAIRKGNWKLVEVALFPGSRQLFDLGNDPGETIDVATEHADIVAALHDDLAAYAREMAPSLWLGAQPAFLGPQGKTAFDPGYEVDDAGLPSERPAIPQE